MNDKYEISTEEKMRLLSLIGANSDDSHNAGGVDDYAKDQNTELAQLNNHIFNLDNGFKEMDDQPLPSDPEYKEFHEKRTEQIKKKDLFVKEQTTRSQRNKLLKTTDWLVAEDSPLQKEEIQEIKEWRQALRDAPDSSRWPIDLPKVPDIKEAIQAFQASFGSIIGESVQASTNIQPPSEEEVIAICGEKIPDFADLDQKAKKAELKSRMASEEDMKGSPYAPKINLEKEFKPIFNCEQVEESEDKKFIKNKIGEWILKEEINQIKTIKRARDENGKFIPDDPNTPDYNEAWEGGKAPEK